MPLKFDNQFLSQLPGDESYEPGSRQVYGACWSLVHPTPVGEPKLIAHSEEMREELNLSAEEMSSEDLLNALSGNGLWPGMKTYSMCYGGHQFGHWADQLGDGRAINLGEVLGQDKKRWTLQLKGAGPTPYSRRADGRAVLRSSVREFVCSEAMYHLGVPTTRALSLVLTGDQIVRDMFYDGRPAPEPGAIVCRVSPSFVRFGNFEIFAFRGEAEILRQLILFVQKRDFPEMEFSDDDQGIVDFFTEVCRRTATMVSDWMRVGYVHGVMNTDNMSILGLTIDYGPYGWIDNYDPNWTPNTTDLPVRRYRFGHQPKVAQWNLLRLGNALAQIIEEPQSLKDGLALFASIYEERSMQQTYQKFGLPGGDQDDLLMGGAYKLLQACEVDMTLFFRTLSKEKNLTLESFEPALYSEEKFQAEKDGWSDWLAKYQARLQQVGQSFEERKQEMEKMNPLYVPRNYLLQEAIELAEAGDYSRIHELLEVFRNPYTEQSGKEHFAQKRPEWARTKPGCSMLSCSS